MPLDVTLAEPSAESADMFELAPISLWLEDLSGVRAQLEDWRAQGVSDLAAFLREDAEHVKACTRAIRVLKVNRKTLDLFGARDLDAIVAGADAIFRDDMFEAHIAQLVRFWEGGTSYSGQTVNYTLCGRRLDIELKATILPNYEANWARALFVLDDVTEREAARSRLAESEAFASGLFEHSPVSLWVEDFSSIKGLLDDIRARGIDDLRTFTDVHPDFVQRCMSEIRVIDVNRHTVKLFGATDKGALLRNLSNVFRDDMRRHFREQLIDLWDGKLFQQREVVNYALDGSALNMHMQFSVLPGHEDDWRLVQIALTDITARKKAEAYLEYLGQHDVLTRLYNRSFYVDELNRLERSTGDPVTIIIIDVNGLKTLNDEMGHATGDALLRRVGEILGEAVQKPSHSARIGGDEFAVLMPAADRRDGDAMIERIEKLVELNNQFYSGCVLSLSMGAATRLAGGRLEEVVKRADAEMYKAKRTYYAEVTQDRRQAIF